MVLIASCSKTLKERQYPLSQAFSKPVPLKWSKGQLKMIREISTFLERPTEESLKKYFPFMSKRKLKTALQKALTFRKEYEDFVGHAGEGSKSSKGEGFIYLLVNDGFPGWVKCGMTVNLDSRLSSYNTNDPFKRYRFILHRKVADRRLMERSLITALSPISSCVSSEWFKVSEEEAKRLFDLI